MKPIVALKDIVKRANEVELTGHIDGEPVNIFKTRSTGVVNPSFSEAKAVVTYEVTFTQCQNLTRLDFADPDGYPHTLFDAEGYTDRDPDNLPNWRLTNLSWGPWMGDKRTLFTDWTRYH